MNTSISSNSSSLPIHTLKKDASTFSTLEVQLLPLLNKIKEILQTWIKICSDSAVMCQKLCSLYQEKENLKLDYSYTPSSYPPQSEKLLNSLQSLEKDVLHGLNRLKSALNLLQSQFIQLQSTYQSIRLLFLSSSSSSSSSSELLFHFFTPTRLVTQLDGIVQMFTFDLSLKTQLYFDHFQSLKENSDWPLSSSLSSHEMCQAWKSMWKVSPCIQQKKLYDFLDTLSFIPIS